MSDAFDIYFFIKTLDFMTHCYRDEIRGLKDLNRLAFDFFADHSGHIEIIFEGHLQRVYFIIHPACRYLSERKKEDLLETVKRDTPNDKLTDLMIYAPPLFDLVDHLSNLANSFLKISPSMLELIINMSIIYSFIVNLIIFSYFKKNISDNLSTLDKEFDSDHITMRICGFIFVIFGLLRLFVWILIEGKLVILDGWRSTFLDYKKFMMKNITQSQEMDHVILSYLSKNMIDITVREKMKIVEHVNTKQGNPYIVPFVKYYTQSLIFLLENGRLKYILFFLFGSIFAFLTGDTLIYAIFLLEITVSTLH